eukprot:scaffold2048_cov224-Pinguiococcus_pyrenoidosus.AAC.2
MCNVDKIVARVTEGNARCVSNSVAPGPQNAAPYRRCRGRMDGLDRWSRSTAASAIWTRQGNSNKLPASLNGERKSKAAKRAAAMHA